MLLWFHDLLWGGPAYLLKKFAFSSPFSRISSVFARPNVNVALHSYWTKSKMKPLGLLFSLSCFVFTFTTGLKPDIGRSVIYEPSPAVEAHSFGKKHSGIRWMKWKAKGGLRGGWVVWIKGGRFIPSNLSVMPGILSSMSSRIVYKISPAFWSDPPLVQITLSQSLLENLSMRHQRGKSRSDSETKNPNPGREKTA